MADPHGYAAAHPQWKRGTTAGRPARPAPAHGQARPVELRPADPTLAGADQHAVPDQPAKLAA